MEARIKNTIKINGYLIRTNHSRIEDYYEQLFIEKKHTKLCAITKALYDNGDRIETNYIDNFSLTLNRDLICKN